MEVNSAVGIGGKTDLGLAPASGLDRVFHC